MRIGSTIRKKVAVIIPCHNEGLSIGKVISKLPMQKLHRQAIELEIYVIDNNSSDNTAVTAKKAGAIVIPEPKKGKGNALRTGFRNLPANIDYVVMLDGDGTYSSKEIIRLIEPLRNNFCDVVVGSRLGGRIQTAAMSKLNLLGNRLFTIAVRILYGANVTDVLTGYFAWKKPRLDSLAPFIKSEGFAIEMEMITKMARLGYQMASVPISYHPRSGESHLHPFKDGVGILLMLIKNLLWHPSQWATAPKDKHTPRKIIFISDSIYPYMKGGKEKRLHEITKRLATMGYDVHIYTMHWWETPEKSRTESGVHLHALCKYHEMYHGDRRTIKEGIVFATACFKLFRVSFDVIDVDHMPFFPIFSTWIVCALRRRKLNATWHEALSWRDWIEYMGPSGIIAALIERASIRLPYRITAASTQTKELLAHIHGRGKRVELVASGIDTALLRQVQPVQAHIDVLYAGRLVKDKNIDKLIRAMAIVKQTRPAARCTIIGQGMEKPRLEALVRKEKLQKNVQFLEPLPNAADLYSYMKAAKVFCTPSVREGFGITALEALGCGTPVITTTSSANATRHLIKDSQSGSIVPLSPLSLATAILYWLSMNQEADIAAEFSDFDWGQLAKKQAEVYAL